MKEIPLSNGQLAKVDDEDFEFLSKFFWHVSGKRFRGYAAINSHDADGNKTSTLMHKLILDAPEVDHRNGDTLDNQRHNLRPCTRQQNCFNMAPRLHAVSRYKGVHQHKPSLRWRAQLTLDYKKIHLGYFPSEEAAARAYDAKAKELFGEFARLNFPEVTV